MTQQRLVLEHKNNGNHLAAPSTASTQYSLISAKLESGVFHDYLAE